MSKSWGSENEGESEWGSSLLEVGLAAVEEGVGDEEHGGDEHEDGEKPVIAGTLEALPAARQDGAGEGTGGFLGGVLFSQSEFFLSAFEPGFVGAEVVEPALRLRLRGLPDLEANPDVPLRLALPIGTVAGDPNRPEELLSVHQQLTCPVSRQAVPQHKF